MGWITNLFAGLWGYVASAGLAAVLATGGTYYVTSRGYETTIAKMETKQAQADTADVTASLAKLKAFIANMQSADKEYGDSRDALNSKLDRLNKDFQNAVKAKPLPADCRPDDARMRALTEAVTDANAAAAGSGFGETLRTHQ